MNNSTLTIDAAEDHLPVEAVTPPSGEEFAAASRALRGEQEPEAYAPGDAETREANLTDVTLTIVLVPSDLEDPSITRLDQHWLDRWDGTHTEAAFDGSYEEASSLANCLTEFFHLSVVIVRHIDYDVGLLGGSATGLDVVEFVPGVDTGSADDVESLEDFDDGR